MRLPRDSLFFRAAFLQGTSGDRPLHGAGPRLRARYLEPGDAGRGDAPHVLHGEQLREGEDHRRAGREALFQRPNRVSTGHLDSQEEPFDERDCPPHRDGCGGQQGQEHPLWLLQGHER